MNQADALAHLATRIAHDTADALLRGSGVRADVVVLIQLPEEQGGVTIGACTIEERVEPAVREVRRALEQAYETILRRSAPDYASEAEIGRGR